MYRSTKTYGHALGLSCAFRQWRAESHCRLLHGYALEISFVFESTSGLDHRNWVVDFGGLDHLKIALKDAFDHKVLVAHDDPEKETFITLHQRGLIDLRLLPSVGCEAFAKHCFDLADIIVTKTWSHVRCYSAEVREHGANSAIYIRNEEGFGAR